MRPANDLQNPNIRSGDQEEGPIQLPSLSDQIDEDRLRLPTFDPEDIIGYKFIMEYGGDKFTARVRERADGEDEFWVDIGDSGLEEVLTKQRILEYLNEAREEDPEESIWSFDDILEHRKTKKWRYELKILWSSGEITWEPLTEIGTSDPVSVARYARDNELLNRKYWKRFKPYVPRGERYVRLMRRAYASKTKNGKVYKFGIEIPKDYKDAMRLDKEAGNHLWKEAVEKEMNQLKQYKVFIDLGKANGPPPPGYKVIRGHLIFSVKYDLRYKVRYVGGGHLTEPVGDTPYNGICSIVNIRICIFLGELNGLKQCACDVGNAYLEAYTREKLVIKAGPEFGEDEGNYKAIDKALYGLRTSGGRWAERLSDDLLALGWIMSKGNVGIWMKDMGSYWAYLTTWVDDIIVFDKDPMITINQLKERYILKGIGKPEYFIGADMAHKEAPETVFVMGSWTYVKKILVEYERIMGFATAKHITTPLEPGDHPELDETAVITPEKRRIYWSLIGMLQWAVTLGRIDIAIAVSTMSRFRVEPRQGHLDRVGRIFGYLRYYKSTSIKFRVEEPDYSTFPEAKHDWEYIYGGVKEQVPDDAPEPKGKRVILTSFVDASLHHCKVTGRGVTGIIHMMNKTPVEWYTKRQSTMETSTYGAEFMAAKVCTEQIMGLRYQLRMMGVPVSESTYMFGDSQSVITSAAIPENNLKKRHVALSYHRVREAIAAGVIKFYHIEGDNNPADVLTKFLPRSKWWPLMKPFLHWLPTEKE